MLLWFPFYRIIIERLLHILQLFFFLFLYRYDVTNDMYTLILYKQINLTNQQPAFIPRDLPIYSRIGSTKYIIFILDVWVHVHLTMLVWFPISMMIIFQSQRKIYNKKVIIHFTVQYEIYIWTSTQLETSYWTSR